VAGDRASRAVDFRLPGIYGPGRSAIDQVRPARRGASTSPARSSRASMSTISRHRAGRDDASAPGAIYNVADDLPAPNSEVIAYACELLGLPVPPDLRGTRRRRR
jgi:nucleoside-diphosphate-sugar epimerase